MKGHFVKPEPKSLPVNPENYTEGQQGEPNQGFAEGLGAEGDGISFQPGSQSWLTTSGIGCRVLLPALCGLSIKLDVVDDGNGHSRRSAEPEFIMALYRKEWGNMEDLGRQQLLAGQDGSLIPVRDKIVMPLTESIADFADDGTQSAVSIVAEVEADRIE